MTPTAVTGRSRARSRVLSILYVGCLGRSSRSSMVMRALRELGHQVRAVNSDALDERGERLYFRDPVWKVMSKLGRPPDRAGLNRSIRHALTQGPVDVLWVAKSPSLRPETLVRARKLHPRLRIVFHSEDDMFLRHNQSSWFRTSLPLYDVVFTHKSRNTAPGELPALGAQRVVFVDKCHDRYLHRPVEVTGADREALGGEVGFVGTFEAERADVMLRLAQAGVGVRIWGDHWKKWRGRHPLLNVEGRALSADEYARSICATDVNLGFLRKQNRDLQTGRSVEIPACGGFMLAERTDEHLNLFLEGVEAEFFDDFEECLGKTRFYVENAAERRRIAAAGLERCMSGRYSFHDRLTEMLRVARGDEK